MFQNEDWVAVTKKANKLFIGNEYLDALSLYKESLSMLEDYQNDIHFFQCEQQIQLLDLYIISCHNLCDCLDKVNLSANKIRYAYRPISLIKRLYNGIEIYDFDEFQSRLDHCVSYYSQMQLRSNPKFIKSRLNALIQDIQLTS